MEPGLLGPPPAGVQAEPAVPAIVAPSAPATAPEHEHVGQIVLAGTEAPVAGVVDTGSVGAEQAGAGEARPDSGGKAEDAGQELHPTIYTSIYADLLADVLGPLMTTSAQSACADVAARSGDASCPHFLRSCGRS